jgi:hypothetical protein
MPATTKAQKALDNNIQEFYGWNGTFFAAMAKVNDLLTPEVRDVLTSQEANDLELFLAPFRKFENYLIKSDKDLTTSERIAEIHSQFNSESYQKTLEAFFEVTSNMAAFDKFTERLNKKYASNQVINDFVFKLNFEKIKPTGQTPTRYPLHLAEIRKLAAKVQDVDIDDFDAHFKDEDDLHKQLRFMNKHKDVDLNDLIKVDAMLKKAREGADHINSAIDKPVDFFKLSSSERTNLHKKMNVDKRLQNLKDMFQLGKDMANAKTADEKLLLVMMEFAETYVDERTQGLLGNTQLSLYLESLMQVIMDEYQLTIPEDKKREEVIFELVGKSPKVSATVVNYLYGRAISEGVVEKDKTVWVNAAKAVVRMGNDAIKIWNRIAYYNTPKFRSNLTLPLNTEDKHGKVAHIKEADIEGYLTTNLKDTPREIAAIYHPTLLVRWLSEAALERRPADLSTEDNKVIDDLVKNLQTAEKDFPQRIHQIFMNEYLQAYITGRTKVGNHSQPGKLQAFLESVITEKADKPDSSIFDTVSTKTEEAQSIATRAVSYALQCLDDKNLPRPTLGEKAKPQFINILKAVKRMGIIDEWNELAKGNFAHLMLTAKTDLSEKGIEKFWKSVKDVKPGEKAEAKGGPSRFGFLSRTRNSKTSRSSEGESPSPPTKRQ